MSCQPKIVKQFLFQKTFFHIYFHLFLLPLPFLFLFFLLPLHFLLFLPLYLLPLLPSPPPPLPPPISTSTSAFCTSSSSSSSSSSSPFSSSPIQLSLDQATDPWGVKVERVEVKDVRLPVQLQRAMAAEAEATREARAKVSFSCVFMRWLTRLLDWLIDPIAWLVDFYIALLIEKEKENYGLECLIYISIQISTPLGPKAVVSVHIVVRRDIFFSKRNITWLLCETCKPYGMKHVEHTSQSLWSIIITISMYII